MWNKKSTFNLNLNNRKGQVALFIALIFQILFLFFAMVINVGLLVHHKINLQNSVDLAAYYGAMKQAESMNAIAHVNYQIRQSWKLLAWRYRQPGTAGDFEEHPFDKTTKGLKGGDDDSASAKGFYDAPSFCITYVPFKPMPPAENTCKDLETHAGITLFRVPPVIIDLPNISNSVQQLSQQLLNQAKERSKIAGAFNYLMLGSFVVAFNMDQGNRNLLITALSRAMSPSSPEGDSFDVDGDSVQAGIRKTLKNNLTSANLASIQDGDIKTFNSLGDSDCNASSVGKGEPAKWLKPVKIYPAFIYADLEIRGNQIKPVSKMLAADQEGWPYYTKSEGIFKDQISKLAPWIGMRNPVGDPYNYSMGVEKNPWCMAYMGVSVKTNPKIPFSPFGAVTLKARAFFKPFGGRIGPWYKNRWPTGSPVSVGEKIDTNLPPRIEGGDVQNIGDPKDSTRAANYSRFIGDKWGLKSRRVLYQFGKAIYQMDPRWIPNGGTGSYGGSIQSDDNGWYPDDQAPSFDDWNHIPFNFIDKSGSGDILAWNAKTNSPSKMRELEMAGILPDAFDFAYYSIEPDFYHNYYTRIRDGFLKKTADGTNYASQKALLGDIGMHKGFKQGSLNFDEFSVKDQYSYVLKGSYAKNALDLESKLTYISKDWKHALTSWAPKSIWDYSFDDSRFGKCTTLPAGAESNDPKPATPGNCVMGGTTGFAVKMVSSDYLRSGELNLGGTGMNGPLLNPPPSDDDF